jgi:tetratricopeptide (TPR) repeat protein
VTWAEASARLWASYWLLVVGSCLVFGSTILKWVQSPFSHNLSGMKLSLLHDPGVVPHLSPFSFGFVGAMVLILGLLFLKRFTSVLGLSAAILLMLWSLVPAQIAYRQPSILRRLTFELQVLPVLNVFSKDYLLQNYGLPELVPKRLVLYSAWGRFSAAQSFLRLGWYCFGLGALLVGIYAIARMPNGKMARTFLLLCLPAGALVIVAIPPAIGQHYFTEGALAATRGRNQEAIEDFRAAMRWDSWHSHDIDLYATIGQLQKEAGVSSDSPERHISRAVELRTANGYDQAIFEFSRADEAGGAISDTVRREIAATRLAFGLALYRAGGISSAVTNWQLALAEEPSMIYVLPYLSRGYYELGRYQEGVAAADQLIGLIKDHNYTVANAYSLAADSYAKLGNDAEARRYYNLSLIADPIVNYWALTGLAGE